MGGAGGRGACDHPPMDKPITAQDIRDAVATLERHNALRPDGVVLIPIDPDPPTQRPRPAVVIATDRRGSNFSTTAPTRRHKGSMENT